MLPKFLKPKQEYDLIRLGQDNDGGYLVEKQSIINSNCLITLGLGYDWSFEKDYSKYKDKSIIIREHLKMDTSKFKDFCYNEPYVFAH